MEPKKFKEKLEMKMTSITTLQTTHQGVLGKLKNGFLINFSAYL